MMNGSRFSRLQSKRSIWTIRRNLNSSPGEAVKIAVPGSGRMVDYDPFKRIGVNYQQTGSKLPFRPWGLYVSH